MIYWLIICTLIIGVGGFFMSLPIKDKWELIGCLLGIFIILPPLIWSIVQL